MEHPASQAEIEESLRFLKYIKEVGQLAIIFLKPEALLNVKSHYEGRVEEVHEEGEASVDISLLRAYAYVPTTQSEQRRAILRALVEATETVDAAKDPQEYLNRTLEIGRTLNSDGGSDLPEQIDLPFEPGEIRTLRVADITFLASSSNPPYEY